MVLDARQLECFVAVAEELNLSRAAERLHLSQPPLTRRIHRLESELEVDLFRRTAGGMELTEPGKILLERAYRLIALSSNAVERTRQGRAGELGRLDIGYYDSAILDAIPTILREFSALNPEVEVRLERVLKRTQVDYLRDQILHVAFGRHYRDEPGIETQAVHHEPLYLAVRVEDAATWPAEIEVGMLVGTPLVLFPQDRPEFADEVVHLCLDAGFSPAVAVDAFDVVSALAYVAIGKGVAVVPRSATKTRAEDVAFLPIRGDHTTTLSCAYLSTGRTPATETFLRFLQLRDAGSR
ncbi:LysR family transcriptional regulator [Nocardioides sp. LMS-CY]|uniref:LysR family transcriptional regulator n=1 Tax=Nocardioides sp. (strain LMS-CY) TaxID=2840457 RepID=UPI001C008D02|nr:LysR family transcriptional regulator [Nocardioides sp. LMS-CY]QWF20480.1 LysR family transcriptional regulator [Nocardioides sp. LMS-CY]